MGEFNKFSTVGIAPDKRLKYWNEIADEVFTGTYVNADDNLFAGEMLHWSIGELNMIRTNSQAAVVGRSARELDEEHMILHIQCRGTSLYRQGNAEYRLEPGDFAVGSSHKPYSFDISPHEMLVIEFPKQPLADRLPRLDDHLARRVSGASPGGRVFVDFLLSLWREGGRLRGEPGWDEGMNGVFYDLAALALRGTEEHRWARRDLVLQRRALAVVESRLSEPGLRTASIAQELGVSIRTVQNLFAAMGTTPMAYILDRRLDGAAERLLADPGQSVTAVAFDYGFSEASYFTRCFRQKFGAPPRAWRMGK